MVCKSIVRGLSWSYGTQINYRSHYSLLTLLAKRYSMTVDELVNTNPLALIGTSYMAKKVLGNRTYERMCSKLAYEESYKKYVEQQKLKQTAPSQ